jgi:quinoprotein glucose dehydrogenase
MTAGLRVDIIQYLAKSGTSSLALIMPKRLRVLTRFTLGLCVAYFGIVLATANQPSDNSDAGPTKQFEPKIAPASNEARQAMGQIRVPHGLTIELFAAEPLLANPVAFCFDEKGRCFVAETFRIQHGVTDNRDHMSWLDDDLASRTVADRVAMYRKYLKQEFSSYEIAHDRVRRLEGTKGNGVADRATIFADGFHQAEDGIGAGVLAWKGKVYFTCIPSLWLLKDTKDAGSADFRQTLSTGYGVHVSFYGHDLHGLRMGPDGRLYFSVGDRGLNVRTADGRILTFPDTGAVLRCEPDGTSLEVVATGLRNPQCLAFDEYGNLFTCDNNSDSGDKARLVDIVEGGDSGWRIGYQYPSSMSDRGPWNAEKLWHLPHECQPAYIVPPLAHIADGPSGFCYNPGAAALPERYGGHFFLCDFRGDPARSGVHSFAIKPKGASFEMVDAHQFVWSVLATDCNFAPDGGFYISDWVFGWEGTGKGRIYRVADPARQKIVSIKEVQTHLSEGFDQRPIPELLKLLEHADMRVRQEAQFALAAKKGQEAEKAANALSLVAKKSTSRRARLHAIWGLGQLSRRRDSEAPKSIHTDLCALLHDQDAEVRSQAARVFGDSNASGGVELIPLLSDDVPRVRMQAAISLGRRGKSLSDDDRLRALRAVYTLLQENANRDPYIRHGAVMALVGLATADDLPRIRDESSSVPLGVLLAMRRLGSPAIRQFLSNSDPRLVVEAARAIHDVPIPEALPDLAKLIESGIHLGDSFLYRALNAHFRLGKAEDAEAVAAFAARSNGPERLRIEAVRMLGEWEKPGRRDRVTGGTQNLGMRDRNIARAAMQRCMTAILAGSDPVREEAVRIVGRLGLQESGPALIQLIADGNASIMTRVAALEALDTLNDSQLPHAIKLALEDVDPRVRNAGRRALAKRRPDEAVAELRSALDKGPIIEQQSALTLLGNLQGSTADSIISQWLDRLLANQVPGEIRLELLEAAQRRDSAKVKKKLAQYSATQKNEPPVVAYQEALLGGDAVAGREVFFHKTEAACLRCHKIHGQGGDVGPELTGIGAKQTREYLLESIVDPSRQIAKGFESVVLTLQNGKIVSGVLKEENAQQIKLTTPEGESLVVAKKDIDDRQTGKSAMPEDIIKHLSKRELRNLIEFLSSLK